MMGVCETFTYVCNNCLLTRLTITMNVIAGYFKIYFFDGFYDY